MRFPFKLPWQNDTPAETGPDGFPLFEKDPHFAQQRRLSEGLMNWSATNRSWDYDPRKSEVLLGLLACDDRAKIDYVHALLKRLQWLTTQPYDRQHFQIEFWSAVGVLQRLVSEMLRSNLPFTEQDLGEMLHNLPAKPIYSRTFPVTSILRHFERWKAEHRLSPELLGALRELEGNAAAYGSGQQVAELKRRLQRLMSEREDEPPVTLFAGDPWAAQLAATLDSLPSSERDAWYALLRHAESAKSAAPSGKWLKRAGELKDRLAPRSFSAIVAQCIQTLIQTKVEMPTETRSVAKSATNENILRGLIWACAVPPEAAVTPVIGDLCVFALKKIPNIGAPYPKLGNACINALAAMSTMDAVAQLSRLKTRIKYPVSLRLIERALETAAENLGQSREQIEELATPTFGLEAGGVHRKDFGDFTAELRIVSANKTELSWSGKNGKVQASVPAFVKENHGEALKELKQTAKEIENLLSAHRTRIERMFIFERRWKFSEWRERYPDHPLLSFLARRLIWEFEGNGSTRQGIWHNGAIVDASSGPLEELDKTQVCLWHPISAEPATVLSWRNWLEANSVTQPFKQAHREVYILTEAERRTATYSNRFASHIIRQHQFAALCRDRGWRYSLMGQFDSHNTPTLDLPSLGWRVEYWVDSLDGSTTSGAGIFNYVGTDQVRFYRLNEDGPRPLTEVPPLIFSELMRDVDLFVGVCSVANDPAWHDRGEYRQYWQSYSFGELSATAETRRDLLSRLLPRLKIAPQCELKDRFLFVRGKLRTYKIHLGSGNILMTPNDQYLCIVADGGREAGRDALFLPFEGDHTLSVILSKAFLLARDDRITDVTITRQIEMR